MQSTQTFDERFAGVVISDALRQALVKYERESLITIVNPELAVVITDRSEWGSGGGIGYWSQCRVLLGAEMQMQEWQWRDRWSSANDRPHLSISGIGSVSVNEGHERLTVVVELKNVSGNSRTATFEFSTIGIRPPEPLTESEQDSFRDAVYAEESRVLTAAKQLWERKPLQAPDHPGAKSYVPYHQPRIKESIIKKELGVAAFVLEDQIDHRVEDRQMRHTCFVITSWDPTARMVAQDHGYGRNGGAFLSIVELGAVAVEVSTKEGKKSISIPR